MKGFLFELFSTLILLVVVALFIAYPVISLIVLGILIAAYIIINVIIIIGDDNGGDPHPADRRDGNRTIITVVGSTDVTIPCTLVAISEVDFDITIC